MLNNGAIICYVNMYRKNSYNELMGSDAMICSYANFKANNCLCTKPFM